MQAPDLVDDEHDLGGRVGEGSRGRARPRWSGGAERFEAPAEALGEVVGHREDVGRGAVVLLETYDRGVRVPLGEREEVLGRGAGEGVDSLVVVADHTNLVALAEPSLEE